MRNVFLIGFMGSGKSTIASCLVKNYGMDMIDMDQLIVEREGMSISDIFAQKGELYFRDVETNLLIEIQGEQNKVVSCGGGVVLREENVQVMKKCGQVVLLNAKPETILERVKDDDNRPLLRGNKNVQFIRDMMEKRQPKYEAAADLVIHTDGKSADMICKEIIEKVEKTGE
jgi:shikimate kinase